MLSACFATLATHSGHDLRNQAEANRDCLGFPYGLQDYTAGILGGIKALVGAFGFSACTSWHISKRGTDRGGASSAEKFKLHHYRLLVCVQTQSELS